MEQEELFEISKRSGFIIEPGVVSAAPYQVVHHTSYRFLYDEHKSANNEELPDLSADFDLNTPIPSGVVQRQVLNLRGGEATINDQIVRSSFAVYFYEDSSTRLSFDLENAIPLDNARLELRKSEYILDKVELTESPSEELVTAIFTCIWVPDVLRPKGNKIIFYNNPDFNVQEIRVGEDIDLSSNSNQEGIVLEIHGEDADTKTIDLIAKEGGNWRLDFYIGDTSYSCTVDNQGRASDWNVYVVH